MKYLFTKLFESKIILIHETYNTLCFKKNGPLRQVGINPSK